MCRNEEFQNLCIANSNIYKLYHYFTPFEGYIYPQVYPKSRINELPIVIKTSESTQKYLN